MKYKKIVGLILVGICVLGCVLLCPFSLDFHNEENVKKGKQVLSQLAKQDVTAIEREIRAVQEKFLLDNNDMTTFSARMAGTIVMGDSLTAGLEEYGLLQSNLMLSHRGKRTDTIDEDVQVVIQNAPRIVFMQYGINDLTNCRGDAQRFVSQYREQIVKIKEGLPNTEIYINSLTPIAQVAIDQNPNYGHVNDFNEALQTLCKELNINYIDNTKTIDFSQDVYEYDGIHPKFAYYSLWIIKMMSAAGL